MYEYIQGQIKDLNPSYVVVDNNGVGYFINISLSTYTILSGVNPGASFLIYIQQIVREDAHLLFGFATHDERETFRHLVSVSGIGANTARLILSSLSPVEIRTAIVNGNIVLLKSIKGIGLKTAERLVVELKDKFAKDTLLSGTISALSGNRSKSEALSAMVTLGFVKGQAEKVLDKILSEKPAAGVEELVKEALKRL